MNNLTQIHELIQAGEGYHLEFKESPDKGFIEEVCAFANSGGGKILLGVADNGLIKGYQADNRNRSIVQDMLRNLQPNLDINILIQGNIMIIDIPEGHDKPYACSRGFYIRSGANSQKLTRNEIVEFFQKEGRIRYDELKHERVDFASDFDGRAFVEFIKAARISDTIDKYTLLKNLGCMTEDERLTNAGVLFFAKDIDFLINHAMVVCVLYKGTEKIHILDKKNFTGNIVENINNAVLFVQRHTNVEYVIKKLKRDEIPDIPEVAIRESIVNAVCHRDYFDKRANVVVEVFDDRVIISNPGGLPSGLKPADFGKKSVTRNPVIASLLHRIDFIEKVGTGINRIKNSIAANKRSRVEFTYDDFFTVSFFRALSRETLPETALKTADKILAYLDDNPKMTIKSLAVALKMGERTVKNHLSQLKRKGLIKRTGPDKGGQWDVL